jgi:hypothetical protein
MTQADFRDESNANETVETQENNTGTDSVGNDGVMGSEERDATGEDGN